MTMIRARTATLKCKALEMVEMTTREAGPEQRPLEFRRRTRVTKSLRRRIGLAALSPCHIRQTIMKSLIAMVAVKEVPEGPEQVHSSAGGRAVTSLADPGLQATM
jgi:hypothetical protein